MSSRADMQAVVRRALKCPHGWRWLPGTSSTGHKILALPDGRKWQVSWSPGDVNAARNLAKQLAALCGCTTLWNRGGIG